MTMEAKLGNLHTGPEVLATHKFNYRLWRPGPNGRALCYIGNKEWIQTDWANSDLRKRTELFIRINRETTTDK